MSIRAVNSKQFNIVEGPMGTVLQARMGKRAIGSLSWFPGKPRYDHPTIDGGMIHKVFVKEQYRRQGVATAMLEEARRRHPDQDIRHSPAATPDGKAWSQARP
jgi:GNAT superfamily N-acetyltransferase